MAWIESHQELARHPKLSAACRTLSANRPQMVGYLHLLWWWCMDFAMDGDLSRFNEKQIADAAEWRKDPKVFVEGLLAAGFLDRKREKLHIHDWFDFCGELIHKRLRRKGEKRQKTADIVGRNSPESAEMSPTVPDPTVPNHKERARVYFSKPSAQEVTAYGASIGFKIDGSAFCDFYESKGWKIGNSPMKSWQAAVRTWKKRDSIPAKGEVVAVMPGIKLAPGEDPWRDSFEKSEKETT